MVTVVVGGQYGSEAKGKAAVRIAQESIRQGRKVTAIRCGGPNAGHVVWFGNNKYVLRLVPAAVAVPDATLIICAGAMIDIPLLRREVADIEGFGVPVQDRLYIDECAAMVAPEYLQEERSHGFGDKFASTQTGTGWTASQRCQRKALLMRDARPEGLTLWNTSIIIQEALTHKRHVIVEGTQGFGLSLYHGRHYPFCTSKDTSAASFISEAGISPRHVTDIVMVVRTYPIRVGGNSGPMYEEINWKTIQERAIYPHELIEMTSVTKKVRRVGEFDWALFRQACNINAPTQIAVHGMDYLDGRDLGKRGTCGFNSDHPGVNQEEPYEGVLSAKGLEMLRRIQRASQTPVTMAFTGPHQDDMVYFPDGVLDRIASLRESPIGYR